MGYIYGGFRGGDLANAIVSDTLTIIEYRRYSTTSAATIGARFYGGGDEGAGSSIVRGKEDREVTVSGPSKMWFGVEMWRLPLLWFWSIGPIVSLGLPRTPQQVASELRFNILKAKNVLANVHNLSSANELWEKFEGLYRANDISIRGANGKKIHAKNLSCWKCGMSGRVKRNCPGGAVSEKDFETSAMNVSLILRDDGDLI
ncbi:F-box/kelch-repeat protein [Trifolium pratense]|uniref:F-box/kelch-repeat protein n=1 Tax=Trifolium pratense TaxID=57577 RepID=A0A2K3L3R0_TRIPR|nr:F-box/kelch-repeat protein [Trifolium pratense]PNY01764.1 F-box/kelch-repeat protein [Trifolium pratense]